LLNIVPSVSAEVGEWWPAAVARFASTEWKTTNTFFLLVMRTLWLERNARVFERSPATAQIIIRLLLEEWGLWLGCRLGRARGIE
jgi:hypothetical protein